LPWPKRDDCRQRASKESRRTSLLSFLFSPPSSDIRSISPPLLRPPPNDTVDRVGVTKFIGVALWPMSYAHEIHRFDAPLSTVSFGGAEVKGAIWIECRLKKERRGRRGAMCADSPSRHAVDSRRVSAWAMCAHAGRDWERMKSIIARSSPLPKHLPPPPTASMSIHNLRTEHIAIETTKCFESRWLMGLSHPQCFFLKKFESLNTFLV
jgi:hypothetical protein